MRALVPAVVIVLAALSGCAGDKSGETNDHADATLTVAPASTQPPTTAPASTIPEPPAPVVPTSIQYVWIIVLENKGYETNFGADVQSSYLGVELPKMGRLLTQYHGTSHASLGNYITMVSGQASNPATQGDCFVYSEFRMVTVDEDGQAVGAGCVYPSEILTIGDQLDQAGVTWRQYAQDMANIPNEAPPTCRHQDIGSQDTWQGTTNAEDQYATRHVPFVYFHSIIDDQARCDDRVVDLDLMREDLMNVETTRNFNFITPDVCSDGHDDECANSEQKGGYEGIEEFLREWIPLIMNSTAYQQGGLILVTFDEANPADPRGAGACCGQPTGPNTAMPGLVGPGGGLVGGVLLSSCIEPGSVDETPYNHYSGLRTYEDLFGVDHLGYAAMDGLVPFDLGTCNPPNV
jgi:phosphatidylinositol-3-phosphatase